MTVIPDIPYDTSTGIPPEAATEGITNTDKTVEDDPRYELYSTQRGFAFVGLPDGHPLLDPTEATKHARSRVMGSSEEEAEAFAAAYCLSLYRPLPGYTMYGEKDGSYC